MRHKMYALASNKILNGITVELFFPVTIVVIPDKMVTNLITNLYWLCLVAMLFHITLPGMKFSISGTQNYRVVVFFRIAGG